nr:retrovirus-related Pol polyprotein from transposon TNT 1-94 [Tanacetum cinerariifolium]
MWQPPGYEQGNKVCLLKKSLYGLKQSPRQWYRRFDEYMLSNGFKRSSYDICVYYRSYAPGEYIYLLLYVDDMLIACKSKAEIGSTKSLLKREFDMKDLKEAKKILGMEIIRDRSRKILRVSQSGYISKILNNFRIDNGKSVQMPLGGNFKLSLKDCPIRDCDVERISKVPYVNAVGSLMYLMVCTRPDIAHAVSIVSRYLVNPGKNHWEAVKWILKYLRGTANVGLIYETNCGNHKDVIGFIDSDYAKDPDKVRSITGYTFLVQGCVEAIWLRGLLEELGVELNRVTVNCDNQGAIHLSRNHVFHERTKHINVHYHFIREVLEAKTIKVLKVGTEHNAADALTKVVPGHKLQHYLELLSVVTRRIATSKFYNPSKQMEAQDPFICNDSYESEPSYDDEDDGSQSEDKVIGDNDVEKVSESSCMHNNNLLYDNNHNNIMFDKDKVLSRDPFNLYDILNKRKDSDDLKYLPGFTPSVINVKEVNNKEIKMGAWSLVTIKTLWGNSSFDYAVSSSLVNSGGILYVCEPTLFVKDNVTSFNNFLAVMDRWDGDCVIMGDFNVVRTEQERYGSLLNVQGANAFNSFISLASLIDLPLDGYAYTWAYKTANKMKDTWKSLATVDSNGMINLKKKLQALKIIIKQWTKNAKKISYKAEISIQSKLFDIAKILDKAGSNEEILSDRSLLLKEHNDINFTDSWEAAQKSKVRWAIKHKVISWLSLEQQADLKRHVSNEEKKGAVWDC